MLDQIQRNYTQRLTLGALAKALGRQSGYLGRLFHQEIGVTVHEYVTRARMVYGAVEIRSGVKVEAVALDLGYRSKKNFYRQFKRRFGLTPEAYRREHQGAAVSDPDAAERPRDAPDGEAVPLDSPRFTSGTGRLRDARPPSEISTCTARGPGEEDDGEADPGFAHCSPGHRRYRVLRRCE